MVILNRAGVVLLIAAMSLLFPLCVMADVGQGPYSKFSDRDLLVETALKDEKAAVRQAKMEKDNTWEALQLAEEELAEAVASGDPDAIAAATLRRDEARDRYELAETRLEDAIFARASERAGVQEAVDRLSEDQVIALNRSLNNALHNRFGADLDAEHLLAVADGNYNDRQINALTKALEEEAKFKAHAERFSDRYEATANDKFLDKAERFESRGAQQKQKFLSKIERFNMTDDSRPPADTDTEYGKKQTMERPGIAVGDMQQNARQESQGAARVSARESARKLARDSVREATRSEKRERNHGRGKGKDK